MKIAKRRSHIGAAFSYIGAFMVGVAVGGGLFSYINKTEWWMNPGYGLGLTVVGLPFSISSTNHAKKAMGYNSGLVQASNMPLSFNFGMTQNGLGLQIQF